MGKQETLVEAVGTRWETLSFLLEPTETDVPPAKRTRTKGMVKVSQHYKIKREK